MGKEQKPSPSALLREVKTLRRRVVELETALQRAEEKKQALLETLEDGFYEVDLQGNFLYCNRAYAQILGLSREEILGRSYKEIGGHDPDRTYLVFNTVFRTGVPTHDLERTFLRPDGRPIVVETSISLVRDETGRAVGFRGIVRDITHRKKIENELAEWKKRYDLIVASSGQVVNDYNAETGTLLWSGSLEKVLGYQPQEMSGRAGQWIKLLHPEDRERTVRHFEEAYRNNTPIDIQYRFRHKNGHYLWIHDRGFYFPDEQGRPVRLLSLLQDITPQKNAEERLRALSLVDELTGIYNRRGFMTLAEQELKTANRLKRGMFLLFVDLDDLKGINDAFGHPEGDQALRAVVTVLKETFRDPDIVARIGGDEFVVLALEGTEASSPEDLKRRLHQNLSRYRQTYNLPYPLSVSVGVARFDPEDPHSVEQLLVEADQKMYQKKGVRRNPTTASVP